MDNLQKQQIAEHLKGYCLRFAKGKNDKGQNKAANSLKGVSSATITQVINGNWDLIKDEMFRSIAAQTGFTTEEWQIAPTRDFRLITKLFDNAIDDKGVSFIVGAAGSGKTATIKEYVDTHKNVFFIRCNDFWTKKIFLRELLMAMGLNSANLGMYELMNKIVRYIKSESNVLIILDEADKLSDQLLYFFITLYNEFEDHCGMIMIATHYLQRRIEKGILCEKKGYEEIFSRGGKKFVELFGVGSKDVRAVCLMNGITSDSDIREIYEDSQNDLRRVRKKVNELKRRNAKAEVE